MEQKVSGGRRVKITKRQLQRIIREEKQRLLKESALDDAGGVDIPADELIQRIEKIVMLVFFNSLSFNNIQFEC